MARRVAPPPWHVDVVRGRELATIHPNRSETVAPFEVLGDPIGQDDELFGIRIEDRARNAHRVASAVTVVAERGRLGAASPDVLLWMRLRIVAVLGASVRGDVLVECVLPGRRELRELEAVAAVAAIAASPTAAEAVGVRRPDACQILGVERLVGIEELEISGATRPAT